MIKMDPMNIAYDVFVSERIRSDLSHFDGKVRKKTCFL